MNQRPKIAIVDSNTLASLGLKQLLLNVMPIMTVDTFGSFSELESSNPDTYFHYFVAMDIVIRNRQFFIDHKQKTIVLTLSLNDSAQLTDFHSLYINQPEHELVRALLTLQQHAHGGGRARGDDARVRRGLLQPRACLAAEIGFYGTHPIIIHFATFAFFAAKTTRNQLRRLG
jgi:hypothetical protein